MREICDIARARGIKTIVDGAHAFAHFPFRIGDLGCDYYGVSLHKWLLAPVGTGLLWMRRELITSTWPLQPASAKLSEDIRKYEEIGTHPAATHNAIAEAIAFHEGIGVQRKARPPALPARPLGRPAEGAAQREDEHRPRPDGVVRARQRSPHHRGQRKLAEHLWDRHRIFVVPIKHADFEGIRVTPTSTPRWPRSTVRRRHGGCRAEGPRVA